MNIVWGDLIELAKLDRMSIDILGRSQTPCSGVHQNVFLQHS